MFPERRRMQAMGTSGDIKLSSRGGKVPPFMPAASVAAPGSLDDRYARFDLIHWFRRDLVSAARILLVGAGALGNEVLKNLALFGVGRVVVCDFDNVELSN